MSRKAKRGVGSCSSRAVPTGTPWCPAAAPRVLDGDAGSVSRRSEEPRSGTARSLRVQRVLLVCSVSGQLLEKYCIFSELHLRQHRGSGGRSAYRSGAAGSALRFCGIASSGLVYVTFIMLLSLLNFCRNVLLPFAHIPQSPI